MFRERQRTLRAVSVALDVACIATAFAAALVLRLFHSSIPILNTIPVIPWTSEHLARSDYAVLLSVSTVAWVLSLRASHVYEAPRSMNLPSIITAYATALALASVATAAAVFVLKIGGISRVFFVYYFVLAAALLVAKHIAVIAFLGRVRHGKGKIRHSIIIGAGKPAFSFAKVLGDDDASGHRLVGVVLTSKRVSAELSQVPVLGSLDQLDSVLERAPIDEAFVIGGAAELARLAPLAQRLIERGLLVSIVTAMSSGDHGVRGRVTEFSGVPMLSFGPMPKDEVNDGIKRSVDVAVAAVAGVLALPVMFLVAAAVKLFDPGPVLFKQTRLGQGGRPFEVLKFRTMRTDAEQRLTADSELYRRYVENDYKLPGKEDPRITRLGLFLRRSSLDELPQLWNVLRGDMALVGPRPIVPAELEKYEPYAEMFLAVRPGLTGLWQVSGRSTVSYPERAFLDLDYVAGYDALGDLALLARTLPAVLSRTGAY